MLLFTVFIDQLNFAVCCQFCVMKRHVDSLRAGEKDLGISKWNLLSLSTFLFSFSSQLSLFSFLHIYNRSLKVAVQGLDFVAHSLYIHTYIFIRFFVVYIL
jgi:amino acid permease